MPHFSLCDPVTRIRAAGRRRAATAMAKRAHDREAAQRQHDATTAASANDHLWASLTDDDRRSLLDEAIKVMPVAMRRHFIGKVLDTPSMRAAIRGQLSDEHPDESEHRQERDDHEDHAKHTL